MPEFEHRLGIRLAYWHQVKMTRKKAKQKQLLLESLTLTYVVHQGLAVDAYKTANTV